MSAFGSPGDVRAPDRSARLAYMGRQIRTELISLPCPMLKLKIAKFQGELIYVV